MRVRKYWLKEHSGERCAHTLLRSPLLRRLCKPLLGSHLLPLVSSVEVDGIGWALDVDGWGPVAVEAVADGSLDLGYSALSVVRVLSAWPVEVDGVG